MKRSELRCCFPSCPELPDWIIYFYPHFSQDESTHACTAHVGELLSDAEEHRIFRIGSETEPE